MKTGYLKTKWLAPVLGLAVAAGTLAATRTYFELERNVRAHEALTATLERLCQDHRLSTALRLIHDGDVAGAAQRLDVMLCEDVLQLNDELPAADERTRMYVEDSLRRIALARPEVAGAGGERDDDRAAAERILRGALGRTQTARVN